LVRDFLPQKRFWGDGASKFWVLNPIPDEEGEFGQKNNLKGLKGFSGGWPRRTPSGFSGQVKSAQIFGTPKGKIP